jgi:hypothetical protein
MGNAMKYTPEGGTVELSLDVINGTEASRLFPQLGEESDCQYLKICVSDTGPGIPVEQRESIFKRFYQLENQRQGHYSFGTGIGLYYVRRLVNLHHGFIQVMGKMKRGNHNVYALDHWEPVEEMTIKFDSDCISQYVGDMCPVYGVDAPTLCGIIEGENSENGSEDSVNKIKFPPWVSPIGLGAVNGAEVWSVGGGFRGSKSVDGGGE